MLQLEVRRDKTGVGFFKGIHNVFQRKTYMLANEGTENYPNFLQFVMLTFFNDLGTLYTLAKSDRV